jgi:O-antigen ligase
MMQTKGMQGNNRIIYLVLLIPFFMAISGIVNGQGLPELLFGKQGRNFGVLLYLSLAIIYLFVASAKSQSGEKLLKFSLLLLITFSIFYGLIQISGNDFLIWGESDRVVLTLGNSNFAAGFIALLLPGIFYSIATYKEFAIRVILILSLILLFFLGMKTISFQFYVLFFVSVTTFYLVYKYHVILRLSITLKSIIVFTVLSVASFVLIRFRETLVEYTSADDRLSMQKAGVEIFKDHLIFGVGPDNMNTYMPRYVTIEDVVREGNYFVPDRTHNIILDHFVNGGILTGTSYLGFVILIFVFIFKQLSRNAETNLNLAFPTSIYVTYTIQGFFNTDSILNMVVPYIAMGLISSNYLKQKANSTPNSASENSKWLIKVATAVFAIILAVFIPRNVMGELGTKKIISSNSTTEEYILQTINKWPDRGNIERVLVAITQNLKNCPVSVKVADRLLEVDKRSGQAWFAKAICEDASGNQVQALAFLNNAIEFQPINPKYLQPKYQIQIFLGMNAEAEETKKLIESLKLK